MNNYQKDPGSFRDPSGFIFIKDGQVYRQINTFHQGDYEFLMESGLYKKLTNANLIIPHTEVDLPLEENGYKIIQPEQILFISYPYEWSFSQLKHAALTTLKIQKIALEFGMTLSDASAYNIQFSKGKPIHIDTLSFKRYTEGQPWLAYKQFCQHFLAPLALMSYTDIRLSQLLQVYIDGIPLDLAVSLLPLKTKLKSGLLMHLHIHAKSQKHYSDKAVKISNHKISQRSLLGLIDHLESTVNNLKWQPEGTEWADYYSFNNYTSDALQQKTRIVDEFINEINPKSVWDIGANTGTFSRIASGKGIQTISFDIDPAAVEKNYLDGAANGEIHILPLILDLTNPSPAIGWENTERSSLVNRGPADMVLALALIHHLAISNNVPLGRIARLFSRLGNSLVIEFVPKSDSQVQKLLATRQDIFPDYTQVVFKKEFGKYFTIDEAIRIEGSERTLYLMRRV